MTNRPTTRTTATRRRAALLAGLFAAPLMLGTFAASAQTATVPAPQAVAPGAVPPALPAAQPQRGPAAEPRRIGDLADMGSISISGRVVEIFGDRFVVEDDSGRALVETGREGAARTDVAVGDRVTVEGRFAGGALQARALTKEGGERVTLRAPRRGDEGAERFADEGPRGGPRHGPDGKRHGPREDGPRAERGEGEEDGWAFWRGGVDTDKATAALTSTGYRDVSLVDRKKKDASFKATDAAGTVWLVKVGSDNAVREREPYRAPLDEAAAKAAVERLGYTYDGDYDTGPRHVEVAARTKDGKAVELELNFDGTLKKERFDD
ncbi:hypothetical protein [Aurantimonas sp. Leaf443]|uniref:hypothetical protein n=1 Tax=Aurantimonas sp. Leaf443 TaxID=1736378 RepID=UPI0006F5B5C3|nr:hypothetical protein [Aurantimonas sp. Leaf443]KQT86166.1 hypothetical protein ASG48_06225 [Aurantimonas sp. Leaf443]